MPFHSAFFLAPAITLFLRIVVYTYKGDFCLDGPAILYGLTGLELTYSTRRVVLKSRIDCDGDFGFRVGDLAVDTVSRSVTNNGNSVRLTWAEFDLLWLLAMNSGRVVSRDELFQRLLGIEYNGLDRTIDVRVSRLRRKLGRGSGMPKVIQSVRSEGYCLTISPDQEQSDRN